MWIFLCPWHSKLFGVIKDLRLSMFGFYLVVARFGGSNHNMINPHNHKYKGFSRKNLFSTIGLLIDAFLFTVCILTGCRNISAGH